MYRLRVSPFASEEKIQELHVVVGGETGCDSPKAPEVSGMMRLVKVEVKWLDRWLQESGVKQVDFVKIDIEGAELDALKGAADLLERQPRPVILVEVQDIRTRPWGYAAKEIVRYLKAKGYEWFALSDDVSIEPVDTCKGEHEGNFVAWPSESIAMLRSKLDV